MSADIEGKVFFLTVPSFHLIAKGHVQLDSPLVIYDTADNRSWAIPAGYATDGGTIPAILTPLVGGAYSGSAFYSYVWHDYIFGRADDARDLSSHDANQRLYRGLRSQGCAWFRAKAIYWGVEIFARKFRALIGAADV